MLQMILRVKITYFSQFSYHPNKALPFRQKNYLNYLNYLQV